MDTIFNREYVETILAPFVGKTLRMRTQSEDKSFIIPFMLETSIESTFQIELNNSGIKFLLKDNYYIKRDIQEVFRKALKDTEIYPFSLDKFLKEESKEDCVVFKRIVKYFEENFNPQIAFTYYNMVKSLRVDNNEFVLNSVKFIIY